jgi:hypothetical protein
MQHIALALITMGVVWFAWLNFKKLGRLKASDVDLTPEERQQQQMKYIGRIILSLLALAILPFLFTILTKS